MLRPEANSGFKFNNDNVRSPPLLPNVEFFETKKDMSPQEIFPTLYDETHMSVTYQNPSIASMANCPNLVGKLEHHTPTTDGSFSICIAGGRGVFLKKALLDSIPANLRPALDTSTAGKTVEIMMCPAQRFLGTVLLPFFVQKKSGERVRIVLRAIVLQDLFMGMFIGSTCGRSEQDIIRGMQYGPGDNIIFEFRTENLAKTFKVKGI